MTKEEKIRFRCEMEARTLKFAADVAVLLKRFGGDENRNTRLQLAKSSTSIGANYREANRAETVPDFLHKIGIVLKESDETNFWLWLVLSVDPEIENVKRDWSYLEKFFRNLLLGEKNEIKSRYLQIGLKPLQFEGGQKKAVRKERSEKSGQKTVERLWLLLRDQPQLSQAGMVAALGITRSTIQKHIANLKKAGRLRRIGPDKGGHWEVK